jgi:hypothetical protein
MKQTAVLGTLTGAEFGAGADAPAAAREFRTEGDVVASYGVVIDLTEIAGAIMRRR